MNINDRLFISDLDGTLLEPESSFPESSVHRLNALIDRGLKFSIATARSYDSTHPLLKGVRINLPVVLFNGVYMADFSNGRHLEVANFIEQSILEDMLNIAESVKVDPFVYTHAKEPRLLFRKATNHGARHYLDTLEGDGRLFFVDQYQFLPGEEIAGFLLIAEYDTLEKVHRLLEEKYPADLSLYFAEDIDVPGYFWLQAFHKKADKGSMVKRLAKRLNIPLANVTVFGDYLNDLSMFRIAGNAFAVENALPQVKLEATGVIGKNSDGGVLSYLESLDF